MDDLEPPIDQTRIPGIYHLLLARAPEELRARAVDVVARNPGCLELRPTGDSTKLELTLVDREGGGAITVLGAFSASELEPPGKDERSAVGDARNALYGEARRLAELELDPAFPAVVSKRFSELAEAVVEQLSGFAASAFGDAAVGPDGLLAFEQGFRRERLLAEAEGLRRVREWLLAGAKQPVSTDDPA